VGDRDKIIGRWALILHAVDDQICLFDLAKAMHDSIKDSELVPVDKPGCGFYYEAKEKVNAELMWAYRVY